MKSFIVSPTMKDFLLKAPLLNRITRPVFYDFYFQLPEDKKNWIKDIMKYNRPEKNITPKEEPFPFADKLKFDRESGKGFTSIGKIKNTLGYKPKFDFDKGSQITKEWLKFAGLLNN